MKHKDTVSAVIGSMFFAVPYLALSLPVLPSLAIGVSAFCAGELVFSKTKNPSLKEANFNAYKALENAKKQNKHILEMKLCIDNEEIKTYLTQIHDSTAKIIKEMIGITMSKTVPLPFTSMLSSASFTSALAAFVDS